MMIGSAIEMLLLSLALADRTRELETTNRQLRENQQVLEKQANHDVLTGLASASLERRGTGRISLASNAHICWISSMWARIKSDSLIGESPRT